MSLRLEATSMTGTIPSNICNLINQRRQEDPSLEFTANCNNGSNSYNDDDDNDDTDSDDNDDTNTNTNTGIGTSTVDCPCCTHCCNYTQPSATQEFAGPPAALADCVAL